MGTRLTEGELRYRMKTAQGNPAALGDNLLVAAPGAGFKIIVLGYQVWNNADTAQTAIFRSNANPVYPQMVMGVSTAAKTDYSIAPGPGVGVLFECNPNEALNINLAAATAVGVAVQYAVVPS